MNFKLKPNLRKIGSVLVVILLLSLVLPYFDQIKPVSGSSLSQVQSIENSTNDTLPINSTSISGTTNFANSANNSNKTQEIQVIPNPDGSKIIKYSNGTSVTITTTNYEIVNYPDGSQAVFFPDGGLREKTYPNGTKVSWDGDHRYIVSYPDGSVNLWFPEYGYTILFDKDEKYLGVIFHGDKTTTYPNGTKVTEFNDSRRGYNYPDGSAILKGPNGGYESWTSEGLYEFNSGPGPEVVTFPNGTRITKYPDGSWEIVYGNKLVGWRYPNGTITKNPPWMKNLIPGIDYNIQKTPSNAIQLQSSTLQNVPILNQPTPSTVENHTLILSQTVPSSFKESASLWARGEIEQAGFAKEIKNMIFQKIIQGPDMPPLTPDSNLYVPDWTRHISEWYASGIITQEEYLTAIGYSLENGIIKVS